ncbi:MAG: hypothetical protein QM484_14405 [Woeseiaceae bacterium]
MSGEDDIKKLIDSDDGLKSKRNMLTITSIILLAIQFSGAKVIEANTFVLKLSFEHQKGVALLLLLAIMFLLIRYFNYARPYHLKLYKIWTSRMLRKNYFIYYCPYSLDVDGLIMDLVPEEMNIDAIQNDERCSWSYEYHCRWFFRRYIDYSWNDENADHSKLVSLFKKTGFLDYLKILKYEATYRITGYFTHRENLDIVGPYILGASAITSYVFSEKFNLLITYLN